MLDKAIPVPSIAIDATSILSTWTNSNETLGKITKLRSDLSANVEAFREAVKSHKKTLEDQIGDITLQRELRKLLELRKPNRPPLTPAESCVMRRLMQKKMGINFLMFISLISDGSRDEAETKTKTNTEAQIDDNRLKETYAAELFIAADLTRLSQMPICAPVVDSIYECYPDRESSEDDEVSQLKCQVMQKNGTVSEIDSP